MIKSPGAWLIAYLLVFMPGCARKGSSDMTNMKEELRLLQQTVERIKPGLGEIMGAIQQHHEKLYFSGRSENWELAHYEFEEIKENLDRGTDLYANFKGLKTQLSELKHITDSSMQNIETAIREQNGAQFIATFNGLTQSCNQCHQAAEHGFIRIQVPQTPTLSNQNFSKS